MVKIYLLPADEGDFIWIRYGKGEKYANIIVDGGTKSSGKEYAEVIENIAERGEKVEALVLTHIDYDHLQGAVEGISRLSAEVLKKVVKRILFNTCRGILRKQKKDKSRNVCAEDQIKGNVPSKAYGIEDAISFMDLLREKGMIDCLTDYVVSGTEMIFDKGALVKMISPGKKELERFLNEWEPYCKEKGVISYATNHEMTKSNLKDLVNAKLGSDPSPNNGASIAFLFEYEGVKAAFLGDAKPTVCMRGLKELDLKMPYAVDAVKLSHHGSRSNTSDSLLKNLRTQTYLLSTNGKGQKVPNKAMIAHLLKNAEERGIQLLCNYDWWRITYHGGYFTDEDKVGFLDANMLDLYRLDENGIEIKDGLKIYGEW